MREVWIEILTTMRNLCEILVAHQMGARIEISVVVLVSSAVCVTLYVGVWVEIGL